MKTGIISDTHGVNSFIESAMEYLRNVDLIIHAGDHYNDAEYIQRNYDIRVIGVAGNCDKENIDEKIEVIANKKFFITHGHKYNVKTNISNIFYAGKEKNADIVIFGHSHVPFYEVEEGIVLINPGSVSLPRNGSKRSGCIINIDKEGIDVEFFYI